MCIVNCLSCESPMFCGIARSPSPLCSECTTAWTRRLEDFPAFVEAECDTCIADDGREYHVVSVGPSLIAVDPLDVSGLTDAEIAAWTAVGYYARAAALAHDDTDAQPADALPAGVSCLCNPVAAAVMAGWRELGA